MGTRSIVIVMDENEELVRVYRQCDGYPEGMGVDLAKLCTDKITNGMCGKGTVNGMQELAARVVMGLKKESPEGGVYLNPPNGPVCGWGEYVYIVRGAEGGKPTIECSTHADEEGPSIFNPKQSNALVFSGDAAKWLSKYDKKPKAKRTTKVHIVAA
jgi:hypothetical protein